MTRSFRIFALVLLSTLITGCAQDGPTSPLASPNQPGPAFDQTAPPDVSGTWEWSRTVQLTAPDWVAIAIFGIQPEGPVTHFRCFAWGTLEIVQTGDSFTGTAHRDESECETRGGYHFLQGASDILLVDGLIRGQSVSFTLIEGNGTLIGSYHGVISDESDGTAIGMTGAGRYTVPGHPSSPLPLDPPPAGTSRVLGWEAWR